MYIREGPAAGRRQPPPQRARRDEALLVSSDLVKGEAPAAEAALLVGDEVVRVVAVGPAANALYRAPPGSVVRVRSRRLESEEDLEVLGRRPDLLSSLAVSAKDLASYGRRICVFEGVVLSKASEREVTSRSGENVRVASLLLGDHTGEVELVAWRDAADKLLGLDVGERVRIYGALVTRREGRPPSLEVRGFTRIERESQGGLSGGARGPLSPARGLRRSRTYVPAACAGGGFRTHDLQIMSLALRGAWRSNPLSYPGGGRVSLELSKLFGWPGVSPAGPCEAPETDSS